MRRSSNAVLVLHARGKSFPLVVVFFLVSRSSHSHSCLSFKTCVDARVFLSMPAILAQRCCPVSETETLQVCPVCGTPSTGLLLLPLSFADIDQALAEAAKTNLSNKRGKKRQNATVTRLNPSLKTAAKEITAGDEPTSSTGESSDLRTGRWTAEEIAYCDKLIEHFSNGSLPIPEKLKLNDFLANMLKSKQSRLTKKMKNARFSAKLYVRKEGCTLSMDEAREFSQLETDFFSSMKCNMERSEIRFHMQKVWRELFSSFCVSIGQNMDVDAWLKSVEEVDRRASEAKDAARKARRKMMMGAALRADTNNVPNGVFINPNAATESQGPVVLDRNGDHVGEANSETDSVSISLGAKRQKASTQSKEMAAIFHSAPYVARIIQFVQTRGLPFEHMDIWAPSFVTNPMDLTATRQDDTCRLCFAGCATADTKIPPGGLQPVPMTPKEKFNMISFGVYSQKFSFVVGSGLPGRIYSSGVASWEQGIQSAPQSLFERVGGAQQWGVETVLGVPVVSPTVGRVVVLLYSMHDRPRDADMVNRVAEELTSLLPTPRWKLVVEVGEGAPPQASEVASGEDPRISELLAMLEANMPKDQHAPLAPLLPGLTSLRLLLVKPTRTLEESESLDVALNTYESYKLEGRSASEIIGLTSRTFMVMSRQPVPSYIPNHTNVESSSTSTSNGGNQQQERRTSGTHNEDALNLRGLPMASSRSNQITDNQMLDSSIQQSNNSIGNSQQLLPSNSQEASENNQQSAVTEHLNGSNINDQVAGTHYGSFSNVTTGNGQTNFNVDFQQRHGGDNRDMSSTSMQQVSALFGSVEASILNSLPNNGAGVSASQLAAMLQRESRNFS